MLTWILGQWWPLTQSAAWRTIITYIGNATHTSVKQSSVILNFVYKQFKLCGQMAGLIGVLRVNKYSSTKQQTLSHFHARLLFICQWAECFDVQFLRRLEDGSHWGQESSRVSTELWTKTVKSMCMCLGGGEGGREILLDMCINKVLPHYYGRVAQTLFLYLRNRPNSPLFDLLIVRHQNVTDWKKQLTNGN